MKLLKYFLTVTLITVFAQSCATTQHTSGTPIDESQVEQIIRGETTMLQIIDNFGTPNQSNIMGDNELYVYQYCVASGSGLNLGYFETESTDEKCDELTVTFNRESGIVQAFNFTKRIN